MGKGLTSFLIQEGLNYDAFSDWNYEELDLGTALAGYKTSSYILPHNPAKKVIIYPIPGQTVASNDNLYLYLNDTITDSGSVLDGSFADDGISMTVDDATTIIDSGDPAVGILVNAEIMQVLSRVSPYNLVVSGGRGYGSSVAASHADGTKVWIIGDLSNHTETHSKNPIIKIGVDQLPFTISGTNITRLNMWNTGAENNANDDIAVLSFH